MRIRPLAVLAAVLGAAVLATWFVVSRLPREGAVSPLPPFREPDSLPGISPPLERAATAEDGAVELRITAGPEPLAGATVRLYAAPAGEGRPWRRAGEVTSDRAGAAAIPAAAGAYLAVARAPGLAPARAEVIVPAGERRTRVELRLEPPVSLEGRVLAGAGAPLHGTRVLAVPAVSSWPGLAPPSAPPEETAVTETDAAGAFRLAGLAPGTFAVSLEQPGYHPALFAHVQVPGDPLAVTLEPLGAIEGTVRLADGRPAAGATVRAASADHGAAATTAADGRFRLSLPAGPYVLLASLGDRAGAAGSKVAVAAGATSRAAPLRLGPAAAIEGSLLRGGAPARDAVVALLAHDTREVVARAPAGPDGRFALRGLAPAAYELVAAAPGASPETLRGVTLAPGARFPVRIVLAGTGTVTGTVRDGAGRPLAGVRVRALQRADGIAAPGPVEVRTGFEGRFRIVRLEVGRAELVARQDGVLAGVSRAVQVGDGGEASVDLVLPDPGVLSGRVEAPSPAPQRGAMEVRGQAEGARPGNATVLAVPMHAGSGTLQVARVAADAGGRFEMTLPAGEYRVLAAPGVAARADLRGDPTFARVEPGRTTRLRVAVHEPAHERGVDLLVLEPGGAPSPGATVVLARPDDGRTALATTTGEDGRVTVDARMGLAGREVAIRARNGGRTAARTVVLSDAGAVVVRLAPGGAIRGLVRGHGQPPRGFTLELASQPAAGGWRTVDVHRFAGDRFELADVPPEPLRLAVVTDDGRRGVAEVSVASAEARTVDVVLGAEGRRPSHR
jgi:hypothetical protein